MASFLFLAGQETVASLLPALIYHCTEQLQKNVSEEWKNEGLDSNSSDDLVKFSKKSKWIQAIINESIESKWDGTQALWIKKENRIIVDKSV